MTDAVIIPFPSRTDEATPDRLASALLKLQAALDEQRRAMHDWRFAMTELGIGVAGLGYSLSVYQDALGGLETKLTEVRGVATKLEGWADGVLADANGIEVEGTPDR